MKKAAVILSVLMILLSFSSCGSKKKPDAAAVSSTVMTTAPAPEEQIVNEKVNAMTYDEYIQAPINSKVVIEAYVQDKQLWYQDKASVYLQDSDGGYFAFEMSCSYDDYERLVPGTKIRVTGTKQVWPYENCEVGIASGSFFEFCESSETYISEPEDVTDLVGTEELYLKMNKRVIFKGMTVRAHADGSAIAYMDPENRSDDIFFTAANSNGSINFCVEFNLRGEDTDVYKAVESLNVGDRIDIEAYLYWFDEANPQVIGITPAE